MIWQGAVTGGIVAGLNHVMHDGYGRQNLKGNRDPKRFFKKLAKNFDASYHKHKDFMRSFFDTAEFAGGVLEVVGLVGSIPTEGASLVLVEGGAKLSAFGTIGNISMDLYDEDYYIAFGRFLEFGLSGGTSKFIKSITPENTGNLLNAFQGFLQQTVLPVIKDSWDKFGPQSHIKNNSKKL